MPSRIDAVLRLLHVAMIKINKFTPPAHRLLGMLTALGIAATAGAVIALPSDARAATAPGCVFSAPASVVCTYAFTGGEQTFYAPPNVGYVDVTLTGAAGARSEISYPFSVPGGRGGTARRRVFLAADQTRLFVEVGGAPTGPCTLGIACIGGYNGGGGGGQGLAGGGGGASDVRTRSSSELNTLASRIAVAAGGGGAGAVGIDLELSGAGGNAGAPGAPAEVGPATGGGAGTSTAGGAGGYQGGAAGRTGFGGRGSRFIAGGGGGGGGWYGGGGGGGAVPIWPDRSPEPPPGAGGGGGSSYGDTVGIAPAGTAASVTISYTLPVQALRQAAPTTGTGMCATASDVRAWYGVAVTLQPCAATQTEPAWKRQQFIVIRTSAGTLAVQNPDSLLCLDTLAGSTRNGAGAVLTTCSTSSTQTWQITTTRQNTWLLTQDASGRTLDTRNGSTTSGSTLVIGNATGSLTQQWSAVTH